MTNPPTSHGSVTRRGFHRQAMALALAGLSAGPSRRTARASGRRASPPEGTFVDIHTHLGTAPVGEVEMHTADELLRWMDEHSVAQAVVLPLVSPESYPNPASTEYVLDATEPHRDRLIPFCAIDPRNSWCARGQALRDRLRAYIDRGARGFGEHKVGLPIDDPRNMALYEACNELKLPVLFHLDSVRNTDQPGLPGLEAVLRSFPDTAFIGHAPGFWASISADLTAEELGSYPKGKVAPGGAIDRLMDRYPNLYGDLSAGSGHNAIARDPEFGRRFLIRRADRLLFGTDRLTEDQAIPQFSLYRELALPEEVQAKVFRQNARRLLGLSAS